MKKTIIFISFILIMFNVGITHADLDYLESKKKCPVGQLYNPHDLECQDEQEVIKKPKAIKAVTDNVIAPLHAKFKVPILENDKLGNKDAAYYNLNIELVDTDEIPGVKITGDGQLLFPFTSIYGTKTIKYKICEKSFPDNCSISEVKVTIENKQKHETSISASEIQLGNIKNWEGKEIDIYRDIISKSTIDGKRIPNKNKVYFTITNTGGLKGVMHLDLGEGKIIINKTLLKGPKQIKYKLCIQGNADICSENTINFHMQEKKVIISAKNDIYPNDKNKSKFEVGLNSFTGDILENDSINGKTGIWADDVYYELDKDLPTPAVFEVVKGKLKLKLIQPKDAGIYDFGYTICDKKTKDDNPDRVGCSKAKVVITVIDRFANNKNKSDNDSENKTEKLDTDLTLNAADESGSHSREQVNKKIQERQITTFSSEKFTSNNNIEQDNSASQKESETKQIDSRLKNFKSCRNINYIGDDHRDNTEFIDISASKYAASIVHLETLNILDGIEPNIFAPESEMSRAEFLKVVLRAFCQDYDNQDISNINFTDIEKDTWIAKVVSKGLEIGIIDGKSQNKFNPHAPITKIEATKILLNMTIKDLEQNIDLNYSDIPKNSWQAKYVAQGEEIGIFNSLDDNKIFEGTKNLSRAELTYLIEKVLTLYS